MPEQEFVSFQGLDRASPAAQAAPGACRVLDGVVRPPGRQGWVPAATAEAAGVSSLNDLSRQAQSEGARLLALQDGQFLVGVDPNDYSTTTLATLSGSDPTRRLKSATVSRDTAVAITRGGGIGDPETLKIVRDDTVTSLPWPDPPTYSVTWSKRGEGDGAPPGTYVVRVAWRMEDGTIGPASGPLLTQTPETDTDVTYEATISVDGYPNGKPGGGWPDRIEGLAIIVHPEAASSSATDVSAPDVPGYRVSSFDGLPDVGETTIWKDTLESIIAAQSHDTRTLVHHGISAGALYSYSGRLVMGDVAYDYEKPQLEHMVGGADGGSDYHLTMRVDIETSQGTITRYADPIGFSASAADSVQVRQGTIFYRDRRARSWAWLVAEDYSGSIDGANWKVVQVQGTESELKEAGNANFSYVEPGRNSVSIRTLETSRKDVTDSGGWSGSFESTATDFEEQQADGGSTDAPNTVSLETQGVLGSEELLNGVRVDVLLGASGTGKGGGYYSSSASITVRVKDGTGDSASVIGSLSASIDEEDDGGSQVYQLTDFDGANAELIEIRTDASASASANGGSATANGVAKVEGVGLQVSTSTGGEPAETNKSGAEAERDRDRTRVVWSETNRPLDLPVGNVLRVGEDADDPVLAITSNAAPISEGQYGDYPLIVLGRRSIWSLQVGIQPFVQSASPIAPDMGVVGREAFVNANGPVVAATDQGLVELTPAVGEVLSTPLHGGSFLPALGPGTSLSYYTSEGGRREVWAAVGEDLFVYNLQAGAWSTLPGPRRSLTRLQSDTFGVTGGGSLQREGAGGDTHQVTIETAPAFLGAPSSLKRLRDVWLVQGAPPPSEVAQYLHARSIGETAVGLDYTTDVSGELRLARGLVRAMSLFVRIGPGSTATLVGAGVRFDLRDRTTPRSSVSDEGQLLGAGATPSDLDTDLDWS